MAFTVSGHNFKLYYDPNLKETSKKNKERKRNIIWYNPPYCRSIDTDVGRRFLTIIDHCFPKSSKLSKILNRNSVKLSYSTLPSIGQKILSNSNSKIKLYLDSKNPPPEVPKCVNHRGGNICPVEGNMCNLNDNIYVAKIVTESDEFNYIGMSQPPLRRKNSYRK